MLMALFCVASIGWELPPLVSDSARPRPEVLVSRPQFIRTLDAGDVSLTQVKILSRHHFSSKLQCMSVVVRVVGDAGAFVLVKGSPEAVQRMCSDCPLDYAATANELAKRGMCMCFVQWCFQ